MERTRRHEDHLCTKVEDDRELYAHTNYHFLDVLEKIGPIRTWEAPGLGYLWQGRDFLRATILRESSECRRLGRAGATNINVGDAAEYDGHMTTTPARSSSSNGKSTAI